MRITANRSKPGHRRGYGLIELTICAMLFVAAMGLMLGTASWVAAERRGAERRQVATQEAANLMERLAARPFDELTPESAKRLALSDHAKASLRDGSIDVVIAAIAGDVPARRITIEVRWRDRSGEPVAPVRLVAWVHRRGEVKS